jgi:hypothetical protein
MGGLPISKNILTIKTKSKMKKVIALVVLLSALSIKIGQNRHREACREISRKMESDPNFGGDLDIETVTTKYGFDLEWSETPTVVDYYIVGFKHMAK